MIAPTLITCFIHVSIVRIFSILLIFYLFLGYLKATYATTVPVSF